jgi:hypothetical protein
MRAWMGLAPAASAASRQDAASPTPGALQLAAASSAGLLLLLLGLATCASGFVAT